MREVVYDAGVLIAAERRDRHVWTVHKTLLHDEVVPRVPAAVVAQVSRSGRQAELRRLLRGCIVAPLHESTAHATGRLLAAARTADVVDGSVVALAVRHAAAIITSDREDIERLVRASGHRLRVLSIGEPLAS
jgi:rRNA-processing protein FCF1